MLVRATFRASLFPFSFSLFPFRNDNSRKTAKTSGSHAGAWPCRLHYPVS